MLYIPMEPIGQPDVAAKQKDLVQRLESTLIHWTRQIKEVLNRQVQLWSSNLWSSNPNPNPNPNPDPHP